ncbi:unnamed protein product [Xylocopa violacea]|uniref:Uncharacterized protein n=1 Tax=Xylocopa violacea TaxID=135666 RepID=A0ABP1NPC1_XYLVO
MVCTKPTVRAASKLPTYTLHGRRSGSVRGTTIRVETHLHPQCKQTWPNWPTTTAFLCVRCVNAIANSLQLASAYASDLEGVESRVNSARVALYRGEILVSARIPSALGALKVTSESRSTETPQWGLPLASWRRSCDSGERFRSSSSPPLRFEFLEASGNTWFERRGGSAAGNATIAETSKANPLQPEEESRCDVAADAIVVARGGPVGARGNYNWWR